MPELKISQGVWNDFVAIAEKRKPEALAQDVLRDFIQHFTDEELLDRSCAAARRAPFRIEESEDVVRQHRRGLIMKQVVDGALQLRQEQHRLGRGQEDRS